MKSGLWTDEVMEIPEPSPSVTVAQAKDAVNILRRFLKKTSLNLDIEDDINEFTSEEVEFIVNGLEDNKATGLDRIPTKIVKLLFKTQKEWFVELMNICLKNGVFPNTWKKARIVLIPKNGKDPSQPSSYRPISLLSIWGKVLDKLITTRLVHFIELNNILSNNQYGFRKRRSTSDALGKVIDNIKTNRQNGNSTCLISLDISNAFNSVNWNLINETLFKYRIPKYLRKIIDSFIDERSIQQDNRTINYNIGVPQGFPNT